MLLVKIINFIKGYVLIQVDGYFLERFINICIRRDLFIWDIHKMGETRMRAKISVKAFKKIRPIARRTKSRVKIFRRRGVPFIFNKYKKRKGTIIGILLCCALLWYFSAFVTGIEIAGIERIDKEVIERNLKEFGVYMGRKMDGIDITTVQNQMMTAIPELSWIGINKQGSKIYVDIKERNVIPEKIEKHIPCNIVAAKSGLIESMDIRSGNAVVKVNDSVNKGDLLVSGVMEGEKSGSVWYVHSFGEVYAKTWYEKSKEYSLNYEERLDTGNVNNKYSLKFMNFEIRLYLNARIPYTIYDKIREENKYDVPGNFIPTLHIIRDSYKEQSAEQKTRTVQQIIELANNELRAELDNELNDDIDVISVDLKHRISDNGNIKMTVVYECREDIAKQVLLEINN